MVVAPAGQVAVAGAAVGGDGHRLGGVGVEETLDRARRCQRAYSTSHSSRSRAITDGDRFGASLPSSAPSASRKLAHRDPAQVEDRQQPIPGSACAGPTAARMAEVKRMRPPATAPRSRSLTRRTPTAPIPVWIARVRPSARRRTTRSAPVRQAQILHRGQERLGFRLDSLSASSRRAPLLSNCASMGPTTSSGCTEGTTVLLLGMGVPLLREVRGRLVTPPRYAAGRHNAVAQCGHAAAR